MNSNDNNIVYQPSTDPFGRAMGSLQGMPNVINTSATPLRTHTFKGEPHTFIVQTFRRLKAEDGSTEGVGDTLFIEFVGTGGLVTRLVCPPPVTKLIARQRDSLTDRTRKRAAKAGYETRLANGTQTKPPRPIGRKRKAVK